MTKSNQESIEKDEKEILAQVQENSASKDE
jgi:hypothetical protein